MHGQLKLHILIDACRGLPHAMMHNVNTSVSFFRLHVGHMVVNISVLDQLA